MDFSQRLKYLRNLNEITQEELVTHLGVGRPTVAGYETKGKQPSFELIYKISDYFNVSLDYLLDKTDIKQPVDTLVSENKHNYPFYDNSFNIENLSPESQEELSSLY